MASGNITLHRAKDAKKDEFYTQLSDIEQELRHYEHHFEGKTVLCNCDDPYESNFFRFFALQFNRLKLKKLIATCYDSSPIVGEQLSLFPEKRPYMITITEVIDENGDGAIDLADVEYLLQSRKNVIRKLQNGDFRSSECIKILKEADIVVTNPPFSLFREYVATLIKYEKKFLIIGNQNAITYREIFSLIKSNQLWIGYGFNMSMVFKTPYPNLLEANRKYVISKGYNPDNGYVKTPAVAWFTNLDHTKRHEPLDLYKKYSHDEYPCYENYNAINVDKVCDIPCDYFEDIGVPITYLDKYNPEQFEIIGLGISNSGLEIGVQPYKPEHKKFRKEIQKRGAVDGDLYMLIDGIVTVPYARIIIKRKGDSHENKTP